MAAVLKGSGNSLRSKDRKYSFHFDVFDIDYRGPVANFVVEELALYKSTSLDRNNKGERWGNGNVKNLSNPRVLVSDYHEFQKLRGVKNHEQNTLDSGETKCPDLDSAREWPSLQSMRNDVNNNNPSKMKKPIYKLPKGEKPMSWSISSLNLVLTEKETWLLLAQKKMYAEALKATEGKRLKKEQQNKALKTTSNEEQMSNLKNNNENRDRADSFESIGSISEIEVDSNWTLLSEDSSTSVYYSEEEDMMGSCDDVESFDGGDDLEQKFDGETEELANSGGIFSWFS